MNRGLDAMGWSTIKPCAHERTYFGDRGRDLPGRSTSISKLGEFVNYARLLTLSLHSAHDEQTVTKLETLTQENLFLAQDIC